MNGNQNRIQNRNQNRIAKILSLQKEHEGNAAIIGLGSLSGINMLVEMSSLRRNGQPLTKMTIFFPSTDFQVNH